MWAEEIRWAETGKEIKGWEERMKWVWIERKGQEGKGRKGKEKKEVKREDSQRGKDTQVKSMREAPTLVLRSPVTEVRWGLSQAHRKWILISTIRLSFIFSLSPSVFLFLSLSVYTSQAHFFRLLILSLCLSLSLSISLCLSFSLSLSHTHTRTRTSLLLSSSLPLCTHQTR